MNLEQETRLIVCIGVICILILVPIVLYSIYSSAQELELATCEELTEMINTTKYGIEYHNEWIKKECWK